MSFWAAFWEAFSAFLEIVGALAMIGGVILFAITREAPPE